MKNLIIKNNNKKTEIKDLHDIKNDTFSQTQHVFCIGCKGIPASYGGFETFMDRLTQFKKNEKIYYHVACMGNDEETFEYNGAECFNIRVPNIGSAKAIYYDCAALRQSINYCKSKLEIKHPVFYIMACRIGPFISYYKKEIEQLGGYIYINPDGHEYLRKKWKWPVRKYWKFSERLMVKAADLLICDSKNIQKYIKKEYSCYNPKTVFIAYGSETEPSILQNSSTEFISWLQYHKLSINNYFLIVGRFVPENNFEIMIREFMKSKTKRDLAIITTADEKFLNQLEFKLHFKNDKRIKFVGTVYNSELLKKIRENAFAYLHGHEVGGTNPSLLEALGSTRLNLLLDVGFNKEVADNGALYWSLKYDDLSHLIEEVESLAESEIADYEKKAKERIRSKYNWPYIINLYENTFLNCMGDKNDNN